MDSGLEISIKGLGSLWINVPFIKTRDFHAKNPNIIAIPIYGE